MPRLGHPLLDDYLRLVAARARPNTVLATAYDLKVFFSVVGKTPVEVTAADVFAFIAAQRQPRRGATVVRIEDGEAGLSARTIKRRLASGHRTVRVPDRSGCCREKPGAAWIVHAQRRTGAGVFR